MKEPPRDIVRMTEYIIADRVMPYIAGFAAREYGIQVEQVDREHIEYDDGRFDEVNILARGRDREGHPAFIVAECKAQPGKKDADRFAGLLQRLAGVLDGTIHPILIGYSFPPEVRRYLAAAHPQIRCLMTYQLQRLAGPPAWPPGEDALS